MPFMTVPNGLNYESLYNLLYHTEHARELYFSTQLGPEPTGNSAANFRKQENWICRKFNEIQLQIQLK